MEITSQRAFPARAPDQTTGKGSNRGLSCVAGQQAAAAAVVVVAVVVRLGDTQTTANWQPPPPLCPEIGTTKKKTNFACPPSVVGTGVPHSTLWKKLPLFTLPVFTNF